MATQSIARTDGTPYWWRDGARFTLDEQLEKAWWIWNEKDMLADPDKGKTFVFTKEINVDENIERANVRISAQGEYTLYINDQDVGSDDKVVTLDQYDIKPYLKKGPNRFMVKAKGDTWYMGLFIAGDIELSNGKHVEILSDKSWIVAEAGKNEGKASGEIAHGVNGGFWNNVGREMVMPDEFYKPNTAVKSPGIDWAKPYAGRKLRILAIIPRAKQRDVVELTRRADVDLTMLFSDGYAYTKEQLSKPFWPITAEMRPEDVVRRIENAFKKDFDLVIFGGLKFDGENNKAEKIFYETVANPLKEFVSKGGGLVYTAHAIPPISSIGEKRDNGKTRNKKDYTYEKSLITNPVEKIPEFLQQGVPFRELPGFRLKKAEEVRSVFKNSVSLFTLEKGRVVRLNNTFSSGFGLLANPANDNNDLHYQYYMSFVIKLIMWASKEIPAVTITQTPMEITSGFGSTAELSFTIENVPAECEVSLALRSPIKSFVSPKKPFTSQGLERGAPILTPLFETKKNVPSGKNARITLNIPELPAGRYFADLSVSVKGKKVNWVTIPVVVDSSFKISSLMLSSEVLDIADGKTANVTAEAVISEIAPSEAKVRFSIIDNYDRVLAVKNLSVAPGKKSVKADFDIHQFETTLGKARAELLVGNKTVSVELTSFTTIRRDWDKFTLFGWTAGPVGHQGNVYLRVLAELGLDATRMANIDLTWLEAADRVSLPGYPAFPRFGSEKIDHNELLKSYSEKARANAESQMRFDPICFNNGDEFFYRSGSEEQPARIEAFRVFLKNKYGNINDLNKVWDSSYKAFEEIYPVSNNSKKIQEGFYSMAEFKKASSKNLDYSRLVDQWLDNYRAYNETAKVCLKAIKKVYPKARVGVDCPNWPHAFSGHDWYEFMREYDYFAPYGRGGEIIPLKQARSYKREGQFIGLEYGGYLYMAFNRKNEITDVEWQKWRLWNGLFQGFTSIWWYQLTPPGNECNLGPGFEAYPTLKEASKQISIIRDGYYTLFKKLKRDYGPIALHDSILSRIVASLAPSDFSGGSYGHNMDTHVLMNILENYCGHQYTFVSGPQIVNGELNKYNLLVMPLSLAIDEKEAKALKRFVKKGGVLIADVRPGVFNGSGQWNGDGEIPNLFGLSFSESLGRKMVSAPLEGHYEDAQIKLPVQTFPADPSVKLNGAKALFEVEGIPLVTINEFGEGKAISLNIPFTFYKSTTTPDSLYAYKGDENHNSLVFSILDFLLDALDVERALDVKTVAHVDAWPFGMETSSFSDGASRYVGVTKFRRSDNEETLKIAIDLKDKGYVYDMFSGDFLGEVRSWEMNIPSVDVRLFSVLPYPVNGLDVELADKLAKQGGEISGRIKLNTGGLLPVRHVFNLQITRPDGKRVDYLTRNLETMSGQAEFVIPIAMNEPKGKWSIKLTDIASRIEKRAEFVVE